MPSATWQAVWIDLIKQINFEYLQGNYTQSWNTIIMLQSWLPTECKKDCENLYKEITNFLNKSSHAESDLYAEVINQITLGKTIYLKKMIPTYSALAASSLETHKWIHREDNYAKPRSEKTAHIGEKT